jgi:hypothetical protein
LTSTVYFKTNCVGHNFDLLHLLENPFPPYAVTMSNRMENEMEPRLIARESDRSDFELHANHPLRLCHARGGRIEALSGTLWITAYNEGADVELRPGQVFVVPNDRLVLIEPLGRGTARIERRPSLGGTLQQLWAQLLVRRAPKSDTTAACLPLSSR